MKTLLIFQTALLFLIHAKGWILAAFIMTAKGSSMLAKTHFLFGDMTQYLAKARKRVPANFESYETLASYESLDAPVLANAIKSNPAILNQMPPQVLAHIQAGNMGMAVNAMTGAAPSGQQEGTMVGGALNKKQTVAATFKTIVSAPFVTTAGSGTSAPDSAEYNIPIFGSQISAANYNLPGLLGVTVAGYTGFAISGATLQQTAGTFPAPFTSVAVDPNAWYFLYINKGTSTKAAMWSVTSNTKYPYTMFLQAMFHTNFKSSRMRYILGNAAEQEQFGFDISKGYGTLFGSNQLDTIDSDIFLSPEQLQTGRMDIDLDINFTPNDYIVFGTDPVNVPSGFRIGWFIPNFARQAKAR